MPNFPQCQNFNNAICDKRIHYCAKHAYRHSVFHSFQCTSAIHWWKNNYRNVIDQVFKIYFWDLRRYISEMSRPIAVKLSHMIGSVGT